MLLNSSVKWKILEKFISFLAENVAFVEIKFGIYLVMERLVLARNELETSCYAYGVNVRSIKNVGKNSLYGRN